MIGADYPFLDLMWTMLVFFLWVVWIWILIEVIADIFRRHDVSGWTKTAWLIFVILLPFLGVFVYIISQSHGMAQRNLDAAQAQRSQLDQYVRETAGSSGSGAAAEIDRAKSLLDSGAINQSEFEALKQKALAT